MPSSFFFSLRITFYLCACVCACMYVCALAHTQVFLHKCLQRQEVKMLLDLELDLRVVVQHRCRELNSGPVEAQQTLLTAGPSFQPYAYFGCHLFIVWNTSIYKDIFIQVYNVPWASIALLCSSIFFLSPTPLVFILLYSLASAFMLCTCCVYLCKIWYLQMKANMMFLFFWDWICLTIISSYICFFILYSWIKFQWAYSTFSTSIHSSVCRHLDGLHNLAIVNSAA